MREDAFLAEVLPRSPSSSRTDVVFGPGDDCAVVRMKGMRQFLLLKTDCIVENVHFLRSQDPARVGWKAICRPLSDIAAMGGAPLHALITIFSPPHVDAGYWKKFYKGLVRAARRFGVCIVGGEISRQPAGIAASVALTGQVACDHLVTRSGGKPKDILFVTGHLGGTLAKQHLDFTPRLAEGQWLARNYKPHAMMDLSDGLGADLPRLARASGCGFKVNFDALPRRRGCDIDAALSDGEDYELLFAISPRLAAALQARWKAAFPKTRLTAIGSLDTLGVFPANWPGGWDHFSIVDEKLAR